jgi:hypothetical protein
MSDSSQPKPSTDSKQVLAEYLRENDWTKELNYKIWVTKGARFCASHRYEKISEASTRSITFLSAYLIIIGLAPVFVPSIANTIPTSVLGLSSVGISILVLAYSLLESSRKYGLKAHLYHDCAIQLSKLYDSLRQTKELDEDSTKRAAALRQITQDYERTLERFENHAPIDYDVFKSQKPDYFRLSRFDRWRIGVRRYYHSAFRYHVLIVLPPLTIIILALIIR